MHCKTYGHVGEWCSLNPMPSSALRGHSSSPVEIPVIRGPPLSNRQQSALVPFQHHGQLQAQAPPQLQAQVQQHQMYIQQLQSQIQQLQTQVMALQTQLT